jgi:phage tail-like protein
MKLPTYLNLDLEAPGVQVLLESVVADEQGALSLAHVHGGAEALADAATLALEGAGAIGVATTGDVYVADTTADRVLRVPACGGDAIPVGCLERMLSGPRGVLAGPREALYVADSGNDRILIVDLVTEQLRGVWESFDDPWDLAADADGRLYVVDHGSRTLVRVHPDGRVDSSFSLAFASTVPRRPEGVLTALTDEVEVLVVFDRVSAKRVRVLLYRLDGSFDEPRTRRLRRLLSGNTAGLLGPAASGGGLLHVAEAGAGRVLTFDISGRFVGSTRWHGPVVALALDERGRLVVGGPGLVRLDPGRAAASGTFRIGPIAAPFAPPEGADWQLMRARLDRLPPGAHLELFAWATDHAAGSPPEIDDPAWKRAPLDAAAWRPPVDKAPYLWVGGRLTSGDAGGPLVRGIRVGFDRDGWLRHLPAIYARESGEFLEPALAALEDALREEEDLIDSLPRLFDPAAAPAGELERLAGWLAYELEESFDERTRREVIARAFELQGQRGTAAALRGAIELVLGIDSRIVEPASELSVWRLDARCPLGFGTGLLAGEPDGAIVGATAELDESSLTSDKDFGAPVFDATAHRFCVRVYGSDLGARGSRSMLENLVEQGRPAETEAHVCVIEPRLRVGFQATVGLDALVGREAEALELGTDGLLGAGAALRTEPARLTVGDGTRRGRRTVI